MGCSAVLLAARGMLWAFSRQWVLSMGSPSLGGLWVLEPGMGGTGHFSSWGTVRGSADLCLCQSCMRRSGAQSPGAGDTLHF